MNRPSLISTSYSDDLKILNWCNNNKDEACSCVIVENKVKLLESNSLTPYFCWYAPCLDNSKYFITLLIREQQKECNLTNCSIELGNINLVNGFLDVKNNCSRQTINNYITEDNFINTFASFIPNLFIPYNGLILIFILFVLIILL